VQGGSIASDDEARTARLLFHEARCIDERDWMGWLDLYTEDAVFWVPAWLDENRTCTDPDREISQIYHDSRQGLEERVARLQSRKSVTTMPLPRTTHFVTNIETSPANGRVLAVDACWTVHIYAPRTTRHHVNFGRYRMTLVTRNGGLRIARKVILLNNDCIPTSIDIFTV